MDIVLRAAAAFVLIYVLLRVTGRRELSTLEPFDLILIVVIGDLVQQGVTQSDMSFTGLVLAVVQAHVDRLVIQRRLVVLGRRAVFVKPWRAVVGGDQNGIHARLARRQLEAFGARVVIARVEPLVVGDRKSVG